MEYVNQFKASVTHIIKLFETRSENNIWLGFYFTLLEIDFRDISYVKVRFIALKK